MNPVAGVIRTPDQRLRVFVSSTLRELASERRAVRTAIERLALAPVMFELGARPHPPRSLYRAYLDQSDIFVGLYWEQYGWVAPGEEVSGLEDEWNLAPDMPKLIYIKRGGHRQERLEALLQRIRDDDGASYVTFGDADELADLVTGDLATLLAERFDAADRRHEASVEPPADASTGLIRPPSPLTRLVGRASELAAVTRALTVDGHRLVTITGPGGIGKSRLAIEAAREVEDSFPDGVVFVDLAPVLDPELVTGALANALGIRDTGDGSLPQKVGRSLAGLRMLLVLDNVDRVVDAAPQLSTLLAGSRASMLATSRILLRVRGEQSIPLGPLEPDAGAELFVERARAVKPEFALTAGNAPQIAAICTALDNLPLALELAAARLRILPLAALVERLDHALPVLVGGARDLPARQRTLRATIEWSAQLLAPPDRELLLRLGVFRAGFGFDAVEWMADGVPGIDAIEALGALVDGSLVREQDRGSQAWFTMLATVREFSRDELEQRGMLDECQERHAQFFVALGAAAAAAPTWQRQVESVTRLVDERDELLAAVDRLFATRQFDAVAELAWPLYSYWWGGGRSGDVRIWLTRLLAPDVEPELSERSRMIAVYSLNSLRYWQTSDASVVPAIAECVDYFRREGDWRAEAFGLASLAAAKFSQEPPDLDAAEAHFQRARSIAEEFGDAFRAALVGVMLGRVWLARGRIDDAIGQFEMSLELAQGNHDALGKAIALSHLGWARLLGDRLDDARACFSEQLLIASTMGHDEGIADALEGMFSLAVTADDPELAGRMFGAAENIRERKGLGAAYSFFHPFLERMLAGPDASRFEAARKAGREAELAGVVELALA